MTGLGGLPLPKRPDQERNYPPTGVQPGSSSGIVRARVIIISGAGEGLFVYNGTPAHGNPPIFDIAGPSTVTDLSGNPVTAGAISDSGMPFLVYAGPAALGNLAFSFVPGASGTDIYGNEYLAGVTWYGDIGSTYTALRQSEIGWQWETAPGPGGPFTLVSSDLIESSTWPGTPVRAWSIGLQMSSGVINVENAGSLFGATAPGSVPTSAIEAHGEIATTGGIELILSGAAETVHTITSGFPAGWTGTVSYWRTADGVTATVEMDFHLTIANGTVVTNNESLTVSVASGYFYPTDNKFVGGQVNGTGLTGSQWAPMRIDSTGLLHYDGPAFTAGAGGAFHYSAGSTYPISI